MRGIPLGAPHMGVAYGTGGARCPNDKPALSHDRELMPALRHQHTLGYEDEKSCR